MDLEFYLRQQAMKIVAGLPEDQECAKRILAMACELLDWEPVMRLLHAAQQAEGPRASQ